MGTAAAAETGLGDLRSPVPRWTAPTGQASAQVLQPPRLCIGEQASVSTVTLSVAAMIPPHPTPSDSRMVIMGILQL